VWPHTAVRIFSHRSGDQPVRRVFWLSISLLPTNSTRSRGLAGKTTDCYTGRTCCRKLVERLTPAKGSNLNLRRNPHQGRNSSV
jgi:hypothetical protein